MFRKLLTLVAGICLSLATYNAYAQSAQVSLSMQDVSLEQVMKEVERQTGYLLVYHEDCFCRHSECLRYRSLEQDLFGKECKLQTQRIKHQPLSDGRQESCFKAGQRMRNRRCGPARNRSISYAGRNYQWCHY